MRFVPRLLSFPFLKDPTSILSSVIVGQVTGRNETLISKRVFAIRVGAIARNWFIDRKAMRTIVFN